MSKRSPNSVDGHVGKRLRLARMMAGLSQEKLGILLGISFQQVQKYEKGTNRVGAGRLFEIAGATGQSPSFFFEGAQPMNGANAGHGFSEEGKDFMDQLADSSDALQLLRCYVQIESPQVRRRLTELVRAFVAAEASDAANTDVSVEANA